MIPLDAVANDEQLLDFALSHICERDSDDVHPIATAILVRYVANNMKQESWTQEDIHEECSTLIADYVIAKLVRNNIVDYSIDKDDNVVYSLTEQGKKGSINDDEVF